MNSSARIASIVGSNMKRLRADKGLSISELARLSGIAKATLSSLESGTGNPTIATLVQLADAFGVLLGELLVDQTPMVLRATDGPFVKGRGTVGRLITRLNSSSVDVHEVTFQKGKTHRSVQKVAGALEQIYVVEGSLTIEIGEERIEVSAGDFIQYPLADGAKITAEHRDTKTILIMAYTRRGVREASGLD